MTNFDALKQIYEALGGDEEITGTNLDALKAIAEVAGSGGGGGGGLVVHATEDDGVYTLDKTWKEIFDVYSAGGSVVIEQSGGEVPLYFGVAFCGDLVEAYAVGTSDINGDVQRYLTGSETGYPSYTS